MNGKFTESARKAIENAGTAAFELGHDYIGTEHLLLGLLSVTDGVAARALAIQDIDKDDIYERLAGMGNSAGAGGAPSAQALTPRTKRILEMSAQEASRMGAGYVGTEHILIAMLREQDSVAVRLLLIEGANIQKLYEDIMNMLGEGEKTPNAEPITKKDRAQKTATPTLDKFSRDFTRMAGEGKFDPIIGRDKEIERVIQIISRRTKNNPCLIGDPGVGKTAIVEGLAQNIISGDVPEILKDRRVVSLDLSAMVAGSKFRGEFEERIKKVLEEVKSAANVILFIDELHTIIGAGAAEGAIDASNILKPSLARGEIQVIGATTLDEYRKYIEKDAALERRFQPVKVDEPGEEEAVLMLRGLRDKYEAHHNVRITDRAIDAAVKLSARYISDRFLPDKAIDVLDEAASKVRLKTYVTPPDIKRMEERLTELAKEKEASIKVEEFEKASAIKAQEAIISQELENAKDAWRGDNASTTHVVDEDEIADIISGWTGVPVRRLRQEESERLMKMEETIHQRVIGQEEAVSSVSRAIRRGRVGLKNAKRPIGSFLFLGPTGVGKTELAKALSEVLFGSEDAMIRVDMSEYMEKHSVSRLVGSPPGYVGYDEGGQLSERVRRKPYSVVLFDEIEKAHPDVFNILLQILEDGHITDAQGRKVDFKNTVLIMTSNAGARSIISPKRLGFISKEDEQRSYENMKRGVMDEVKNIFRPEFLNRIDDIIVFHALTKEHVQAIVRLMCAEVARRVKQNAGIDMTLADAAVSSIADAGFDQTYGARPLRRAIQTKIEDALAERLLDGTFAGGDSIAVDCDDGEIVINKV